MGPDLYPSPGSSLQLPLQTSSVYFAEVVVREALRGLSSNSVMRGISEVPRKKLARAE